MTICIFLDKKKQTMYLIISLALKVCISFEISSVQNSPSTTPLNPSTS